MTKSVKQTGQWTGSGTLRHPNQQPMEVSVRINNFVEVHDAGHGELLEGLKDMVGSVQPIDLDADLFAYVGERCTLDLEDGRYLEVIVENTQGRIVQA